MLIKQTKPFAIGMLARFHDEHPSKIFEMIQSLKLEHFQLGGLLDEYLYGEMAGEKTGLVQDLIKKTGVTISSIFVSFHGQNWSDHKTLGFVPQETRGRRIARTCMTSMWAKQIGTPQICWYVEIPEDHHSITYKNFYSHPLEGGATIISINTTI